MPGNKVTTRQRRAKRRVKFRANHDVAIHVPDLARAKEFYGKQLGFKVKSSSPEQISLDAGTFTLWVNRDTKSRSYIPSFSVSDYGEAKQLLESAGCKPESAYFKDPFGFVFDIVEQ
jgi:predicted enzyme related to lactoylglutathione lyase